MPMTTSFRGSNLDHWFLNSAIANIGDATGLPGAATVGSLYVSLHTSSPGVGGNQTTNETTYGSYARVAVARSGSGWTRTGNSLSPVAHVDFPESTSGSSTVYFWGLGASSSGSGTLLWFGGIGPSPVPFTAVASTDIFVVPGQSFSVSDTLCFWQVTGQSLPTGVSEGTVYYVKTVSGSSITISATDGGATIDITTDGAGFIQKLTPIAVVTTPTPVTPRLKNTSTFVLD